MRLSIRVTFVIKSIIKELNLDDKVYKPQLVQRRISSAKNGLINATEYQNDTSIYSDDVQAKKPLLGKIYGIYEKRCFKAGAMDFDDLLFKTNILLKNHNDVLLKYQSKFRYILVDEFQDSNTIQYAWLRVLAGDAIPVVAVGDDDQSIYGWRGAKIENIQRFTQDFRDTQVVRLEQNYRSTKTILDAANGVISHNSGRLGKNLWTAGEDGEAIKLYAGFNEQDEARFIVEQIQGWTDDGNLRRSSAVLYRSNAQSRVIEEALIRVGMPYRIYGGQRFYERLEIRNALAYLRLITGRGDDPALERVINTPTRGIGSKTIDDVRALARERDVSMWQAIEMVLTDGLLTPRARTSLAGFKALVDELDSETLELPLEECVEHVIHRSGLLEFHRAEKGERGQARVENLEELVSAAKTFRPEDDTQSPLQQFLDSAALDAGDSQADPYEDSVQMMTLHSAKGLEFPLVILAGLEENLFPHRMSIEEPGRLEEERRLAYVGITRAQQKLLITYAESRRLHGNETYNTPSRFVREIPSELIEEVRLHGGLTRPLASVGSSPLSDDNTGLSLGQPVMHPMFGEGVVLNIEGRGANARIEVNFAEGSKWLVLQYANLQAL